MIDIGAIWPLSSPWASAMVLEREKNGKMHFCINLRKLNSLTVKDAYSILQIQDTLDSLQGAVWLTLLEMKNRYWQVELEEASKALMAFIVAPLGFYECKQMLFGLMNDPATFQHLMEPCLGNLQF